MAELQVAPADSVESLKAKKRKKQVMLAAVKRLGILGLACPGSAEGDCGPACGRLWGAVGEGGRPARG